MRVPDQLAQCLREHGPWQGRRICVAFSGGLDSTVLLHALLRLRPDFDYTLVAAHVDHGLHPESGAWARHCAAQAAACGVELVVLPVQVAAGVRQGVEAAARAARYAALQTVACDALMLGHHRDDQAESVLLALLRGSGPAGLAGMGVGVLPARHPLKRPILRPWLSVARSTLRAWAEREGLHWIEDPANADPRFDRNFLRTVIGPALAARFPAWSTALARSAGWAAEAQQLLDGLAERDLADFPLAAATGFAGQLPGTLADYQRLEPARCRNLLRYLLGQRGAPPPPGPRLAAWLGQWTAPADRLPALAWGGWVLRRWSDRLWLEPPCTDAFGGAAEPSAPTSGAWACWTGDADATVVLPAGGRLVFRGGRVADPPSAGVGRLSRLWLRADCGPLRLGRAPGSARLRPHPGRPSRELRKLFQEAGVPPWQRARMPGLFAGAELIGVAGLALAADWQAPVHAHGWQVLWHDAAVQAVEQWHGQPGPAVV